MEPPPSIVWRLTTAEGIVAPVELALATLIFFGLALTTVIGLLLCFLF